jgi:hypothetical protein
VYTTGKHNEGTENPPSLLPVKEELYRPMGIAGHGRISKIAGNFGFPEERAVILWKMAEDLRKTGKIQGF